MGERSVSEAPHHEVHANRIGDAQDPLGLVARGTLHVGPHLGRGEVANWQRSPVGPRYLLSPGREVDHASSVVPASAIRICLGSPASTSSNWICPWRRFFDVVMVKLV